MRNTLVSFLIFTIVSVAFLSPFSISFTRNGALDVEQQIVLAQQQTELTSQSSSKFNNGCGWTNPAECIPYAVYYYFLWPTGLLAMLSARMLDFFIFFSISSTTYKGIGFIEDGWSIVRDITNIFFIFALLIIAIGTILRISVIDTKKLLIKVIVVALLINFSLFFARVVVDASNILTHVFYNRIEDLTQDSQNTFFDKMTNFGKPKNITVALMNEMNPQNLLSEGVFGAPLPGNVADTGNTRILYATLISLIAGGFNLMLIILFVTVGWVFLSRVVTLALAMIMAPFAFITLIFPRGESIQKFGFRAWSQTLLKASFLAPIFVFFMYLIIRFVKAPNFIRYAGADANMLEQIFSIAIPFIIIFSLLTAAKKIAVDFSGELGASVAKGIEGVTKMGAVAAAGIATGGTAALAAAGGRNIVGGMIRGGSKWEQSTSGAKRFLGGMARKTGRALETSSTDFRTTKVGKWLGQQEMMNAIGIGGAAGNMFTKTGGWKQGKLDQAKAIQKKLDKSQLSDDEKPVRDYEKAEGAFQRFAEDNKSRLDILEKGVQKAREDRKEFKKGTPEYDNATNKIKEAQARVDTFKDTPRPMRDENGQLKKDRNGNTVDASYSNLEKARDDAKEKVDKENRRRRQQAAKDIEKGTPLTNLGRVAAMGIGTATVGTLLLPGLGTAIAGALTGAGIGHIMNKVNASTRQQFSDKVAATLGKIYKETEKQTEQAAKGRQAQNRLIRGQTNAQRNANRKNNNPNP